MKDRRIQFELGVTYDTPHKKLKQIPKLIEKIITSYKSLKFDRVHFKKFGDSSIDYEIVYYVKSPEYNTFMDMQQKINLRIVEEFEKKKIEMAYPTRTVYLKK